VIGFSSEFYHSGIFKKGIPSKFWNSSGSRSAVHIWTLDSECSCGTCFRLLMSSSKHVFMLRQLTLLIGDVFCSFLLEQEAGHGMDVTGMKRIQLLIWQHAAKCIEVCSSLISCTHFYSASTFHIARSADHCNSQRNSVRPSVYTSITFRCFVQINEDTIVQFSAAGRKSF